MNFFKYLRSIVKKICIIAMGFICLSSVFSDFVEAFDVSADAAVLICADTSEVLFAKNEFKPRSMASTTKIMTSIIALEQIDACGDRDVVITDEMVNVEGCAMGLRSGDVVSLSTLVKGALLPSGNDAATSIAFAISGSKEKFADLMNEKAKQIGMKDSYFVTPSGLDEGDHHSTAYDMAILGSYCMENEGFCDIVSKKSMQVEFKNPQKTLNLRNHNKLLRLYKNCIGIKTGFTKKSGRCLVSCAENNGARLICVTLDAPNDWDDHINLFNFGFSNVTKKLFEDKGKKFSIPVKNAENCVDKIEAVCEQDFSITSKIGEEENSESLVELPEFVVAPVERGQVVGKIVYKFKGKVVGQNDIVSSQDVSAVKVKRNFFQKFFCKISSLFR